jgi:hypothetical protein
MKDILDDDFIDKSHNELPSKGFETYRMFTHESIARDFVSILIENDIPYKLEKGEFLLDGAIIGNSIQPKIALKLLANDFSKVNQLLEKDIENKKGEYYEILDDFSKEELFDILTNPDEWSAEAIATAKIRLQQQGEPIDDDYIKYLKDKRLAQIRKGKKPHITWPVIYLIMGVVGGFLILFLAIIPAIGMGWYYWQGKNVDFEGKKYYNYEVQTRQYGLFIFVATITSSLLGFLIWTYWLN